MDLKQNVFTPAPVTKVMINIGCLMDIPTGTYIKGLKGEHILNGGLGTLTGFVGMGNSFKSTLMHECMLVAMSRMGNKSSSSTYDTEINIHETHLKILAQKIKEFNGEDIIDTGRWVITDKTIYTGDAWYDIFKKFMEDKRDNASRISVKLPFPNRERTGNLSMIQPTFNEVDSLSEFVTKDVVKMQDENSLGDKGANTVFMRQGLQKNRFLAEIPALAGGSSTYVLMVAQIGDKFEMDPNSPKPNKLAHLKGDIKIKGVPEKFTFIMNNCWHCYGTIPLINQTTKAPEYPRDGEDNLHGDTDLSIIRVRQLRSKSGPSGMAMEILVSQQEGVLSSLTEFHYIKENERWGLDGSLINYNLVFCPDIKLSRTTVRGKIDRHPELQRGLNIAAELLQINDLWHHIKAELKLTPRQLYDGLTALGYDWSMLLKTRGWWAPEGEFEDIPFLSTMDLLLCCIGDYIPYWMDNPPQKAIDLYNSRHDIPWSRKSKK
jgi:hypothetical protein